MNDFRHNFKTIGTALLISMLSACGGGNGGNTSAENDIVIEETSDIEVIATSPDNMSIDVDRNPPIRIQFSDDILPTSVDNTSFQLITSDTSEPAPGLVSAFSTDSIDFSVSEDLHLLTTYTGQVNTTITDLNGLPMANSFEWEFVTRDGVWRESEEAVYGSSSDPVTITDANNTIWFYYRINNLFSLQNDIYARPLLADNTLGDLKLVSNNSDDEAVNSHPQILALANGDQLAVWQDIANDDSTRIWYNRFDHSTDMWGTSQRISINSFNEANPVLSSNDAGDTLVLFEFEDSLSMQTDLRVSFYDEENDQWIDELQVVNNLDQDNGEGHQSIAMDNLGNALLVLFQNDSVRSRFYNAVTESWENVELIDDMNAGDTHPGTQLVVDSHNNFTLVWSQENTLGIPLIWSSQYTAEKGWNEASPITGSLYAENPVMTIDQADNMTLVWEQDADITDGNLLTSRLSAQNSVWSAPELLEDESQPASQVQLSIDNAGNVMAIWNQSRSGTFIDVNNEIYFNPSSIWVRRFDNSGDGSWLSPQVISELGDSVNKPTITQNSSGEIMAFWMHQIEGFNTIQSRWFD